MDFIHDQLTHGRRFRTLTIVDDFTKQCPALWSDLTIGGTGVVSVLNRLAQTHGLPQAITWTTALSSPAKSCMTGRDNTA